MKRLIFLLLALPVFAGAQTEDMEMGYLNSLLKAGKMTGEEARARIRDYKAAVAAVGGYPKIPYDTTTLKINFEFVLDLPGVQKKTIFNRAKEWLSLEYRDLDAVLKYENLDDGKIVAKGYVSLPFVIRYRGLFGAEHQMLSSTKLYFATVMTIKDGKLKVAFDAPFFEYHFDGAVVGSTYFPSSTSQMWFGGYFPIAQASDKLQMQSHLELLRDAVNEFDMSAKALGKYIKTWQDDYKF